ncbi:MAG: hypothetical protein NTX24_02505 [Candidatus Pacearchaeota archaeon]|nr:hypothetical protein [Candidatus Pacearchaeota archaeon]
MKNKMKLLILVIAVLFLATWFFLLASNPESHFRITRDGIAVDRAEYSKEIGQDLSKAWLEQNCEIQNQSEIVYQCNEYSIKVWNQIK